MSEDTPLRIFIMKRYEGEEEPWYGALIVLAHSETEARDLAASKGWYYERDQYQEVVEVVIDGPKVVWDDYLR